MRVLYFVAIWFHFFPLLMALLSFFLLLLSGFLFSFCVVKSVFCGSLNTETLTSSNEELSLSEVPHSE
jgi:hypothetical protein